jgi:Ni/Fe-hydrogenase subunit HybB-like protein
MTVLHDTALLVEGKAPLAARNTGLSDEPSLSQITQRVSEIVERPASRSWLLLFGLVLGLFLMLSASLTRLVGTGIGVWGNNQSVAWAWDIAGFVFWIGIGHAGTLISAVLFLFRQRWRTIVSRAAEAITLFAVITAAIYPVFHMGRVWLAYWLFPVPNQMQVWPNFKSPLVWDVFAVSSYFLVSAMFWYLGLVPDLATLRDRAATPGRRRLLEVLSLGWRGSQRHYKHYEKAYLILAGLATPLVISVHTVVSFDFAVSNVPGWHSTLFPPYFVAGAIFSGSAMVVTLMVFARKALRLKDFITVRHLAAMNKIVLATGCMLAYSYAVEFFLALQSGDRYESATIIGRMTGPYAWACWLMLGCNALLPQLYWSRRIRTHVPAMLVISILINVGMWLERFVIIVTGQHRSFLPSTWFDFHPTLVDASTFLGTFGLFLTLFVLFVRFVPILSMSEVKGLSPESTETRKQQPVAIRRLPVHEVSDLHRRKAPTLLLSGFSDEASATNACRKLVHAGLRRIDAHAPYPAHDLTRALPIRPSPLPWIALGSGVLGGTCAFLAQSWIETRGYPMQIGGKPSGSWQALVPVTFEVTILCAALGCFLGLWLLCGLPNRLHPALRRREFEAVTDDRFFISISGDDPKCAEAAAILRGAGAHDIIEVSA